MKKNIVTTFVITLLLLSIVFALPKEKTKYTLQVASNIEIQQDTMFTYGKALFKENCRACHSQDMIRTSTAPPLGGVTKKRNKEWLYKFTKNSLKMYKEGDSLAVAIGDEYWGLMTSFPMLADKDLDKIYYYVEKRYEMSLQGIPVPIEFEFKAAENNNAKACTHILIDKEDILNVSVSKTRHWTFSCKRTSHSKSNWKKTTLKAMFDYDKSVNEIAALVHDFSAFRSSKTSYWDFK
ncbi:cytochrome c [uncultured Kordia sp.]|uniref:c-type cytochrome n=1 Tax=uncultured Kordia sp. TaxID=507699 RepID=UPI002622AF7C|nr:cytochrome c [uncultured Kordia sp.]